MNKRITSLGDQAIYRDIFLDHQHFTLTDVHLKQQSIQIAISSDEFIVDLHKVAGSNVIA